MIKKLFTLIIILLTCVLVLGCNNENEDENKLYEKTFFDYMHSYLTVKLKTSSQKAFDDHMENIEEIYKEIHIISDYQNKPDDSSNIINNLKTINDKMKDSNNEFETFEINKEFYNMLELANEYRIQTNGHFNVGIGYHIELWKSLMDDLRSDEYNDLQKDNLVRITKEKALNTQILDESYILEKSDNKYYVKVFNNVLLDFGAFAKGYGTQKIVDYMIENEITHYSVDGGSSALSYGLNTHKDRDFFNIGLKDPQNTLANYATIFNIKNLSVATSGSYESFNYIMYNDERIHHIISAKTGFPVNNYLTVTMLGTNASALDPYTTAIFGMSEEEIKDFILRNELNVNYVLYKMDNTVVESFKHFDLEFNLV